METTKNNNDNTLLWNDLIAGRAIKADGSLKTGVLLKLHELFSKSDGQTEEAKNELLDIIEYLDRHLIEIKSITPVKASKKNGVLFKYEYSYKIYEGETQEQVIKGVNDRLVSAAVTWAVADMTGRGPEFIKFLIKAEGEIKKQQKRTRIKHGPEITEQILRAPNRQPTLWDAYDRDIQRTLIQQRGTKGAAIEFINSRREGTNLSRDEEKILWVVREILHEKSQNSDERRDDYFTGNLQPGAGEKQETGGIDPRLLITFTEVARKFSGQDRPGGREQETARRLIHEIATNPDKQCLMKWTRYLRNNDEGGPRKKGKKVNASFWQEYAPLWTIGNGVDILEDGEKTSELYLKLHPIFRENIEKQAIRTPELSAIYAAYGSSNPPLAVMKFILLLGEAHIYTKKKGKTENGNRLHEVGQVKLFEQIAPDYNKPGKMKRITLTKNLLTKGIETAKKLGMIAGATTRTNPDGEIIYIFELIEGWRTGGDLEP